MESLIINNNTAAAGRAIQNNEIRLDLSTSLVIKNKKIALSYLGIYYSWRNITSAYNNNFFQYRWIDGVTYNVAIPDGFFQINDICTFMQSVMFQNRHYMVDSYENPVYFIRFSSNPIYYCTTVDCFPVQVPLSGTNPWSISNLGSVAQLVIIDNALTVTLGLSAGSYPLTANTTSIYSVNSQAIPNISNITTVYVASNVVGNTLNLYRNVFYQFAPTSAYGSYLVKEPYQPTYYNVDDGTYNSVSLQFFDQNYQPIPIIDRNITATLVFADK